MTGTPAQALSLIREMARAFPRTGWDEASRRWGLPGKLQELAGLPGAHLHEPGQVLLHALPAQAGAFGVQQGVPG